MNLPKFPHSAMFVGVTACGKIEFLLRLLETIYKNHFEFIVLTQKYNSVSKDVREQIKWLCLFFMKDRDSFEDCLRENDVIPDKNERNRLRKCLQDRPYSKLILKCYQPTGYHLL